MGENTCVINGKIFGCFTGDIKVGEIRIENKEQNEEQKPITLKLSAEGTIRLSKKSKNKLKVYIKTTFENIKLERILKRTNKSRVRKKLQGRINRNIYKQKSCGC